MWGPGLVGEMNYPHSASFHADYNTALGGIGRFRCSRTTELLNGKKKHATKVRHSRK